MANVSTYRGGDPIARAAGSSNAGVPDLTILRNEIDAGRIVGGAAIADTVDILEIPANTLVLAVLLEVVSTEATVTLALGDATDPDGFLAAQSLAVAGLFQGAGAYLVTTGSFNNPKLYTSDTMLSATVAGAAFTDAVIRVTVVGINTG